MNFGTLKDIFTEKLIESYLNQEDSGKILYKKFLKTIKESETLRTAFIVYKNLEGKTIKNELSDKENVKPITESIERVIDHEPQSGSAMNLIESKTYENPQFLRMKDIMSKIAK